MYWYCALESAPPMRIGGGFCRKAVMPGTRLSLRPQLLDDLVGVELALARAA